MTQKTSMLYWHPLIEGKIPTPKTAMMPLIEGDLDVLFSLLDGETVDLNVLDSRLIESSKQFRFPLFMRTDFTSGKHDWERTCYVMKESDLVGQAVTLFEDTLCKDLSIGAYIIREYIPLESGFVAFRGKLPISKERRYFVEDGSVLCHHPYWPADAIERTRDLPHNWRAILADLNREDEAEIAELSAMAETFAVNVPGAWSVDFAKTKDGRWIMIDAAEAFRSWHPSDCPIAFPEKGMP